jgi:glucokinase
MSHAIGIDVGGTKIAGGIVDLRTGALRSARSIATGIARGNASVFADVAALVADLRQSAHQSALDVGGVGLGICEIVASDGGLRSGSTVDWRGFDLGRLTAHSLPVHLVSDVRAAALAEAQFGGARNVPDAIYVTIGTGIASTLLLNGRPYLGAHGGALVLASALDASGCGGPGEAVLEDIASGRGLSLQWGNRDGDARPVIAAAQDGDARAQEIVARAAKCLGGAVAQLANCLDPAMVLIGGGLGSAAGAYFEMLKTEIAGRLWTGMSREIAVRQAELGRDAGVIGAALAWSCDQR